MLFYKNYIILLIIQYIYRNINYFEKNQKEVEDAINGENTSMVDSKAEKFIFIIIFIYII